MRDWKKVFKEFHNDNEDGGSSRWLVAPNIVEMFIETNFVPKEEIEDVIKKGHGGGNWRRLLFQVLGV